MGYDYSSWFTGVTGIVLFVFLVVWGLALLFLPLIVLGIHSKSAAILSELRRLNASVDEGIDVTPRKRAEP